MRTKRILALVLAVSLLVSGIFCYNSIDKKEVTADEKDTKVLEIVNSTSELSYLTGDEKALADLREEVKKYSEALVNGEDVKDDLLPLISISTIKYSYEYEKEVYDFTESGDTKVDGYFEPYTKDKDFDANMSQGLVFTKSGNDFVKAMDDEDDYYLFYPAYSGNVKCISKDAELSTEPIYSKYFTKYTRLKNENSENLGTVMASIKTEHMNVGDVVTYDEDKCIKGLDVTVKKAEDVKANDLGNFALVYIDKDADDLAPDTANELFDMLASQNIACVFDKDSSLILKDKLNNTEKLKLALTMTYPSVIKKLVQMANKKEEVTDIISSFDSYSNSNGSKGLVDTYIGYLEHQTDENREEEVISLGIDNESLSKDVAEHFVLALDDVIRTDSISTELTTTEELKGYLTDTINNQLQYARTVYTTDEIDGFETGKASVKMAFDFLLHTKRNTYNKGTINVLEVEPCNDFFDDEYWDLKILGKRPYSMEKIKVTRMQSKQYASYKGDVNSEFDFVYIGSNYSLLSHEKSSSSDTKWIDFGRNVHCTEFTYDCIDGFERGKTCTNASVYFDLKDCAGNNIDDDYTHYKVESIQIRYDITGKAYYQIPQMSYIGPDTNNNWVTSMNANVWYDLDLNKHYFESQDLFGYSSITFKDNLFIISVTTNYGDLICTDFPIYIDGEKGTLRFLALQKDVNSGNELATASLAHGGVYSLYANGNLQELFSPLNFVPERVHAHGWIFDDGNVAMSDYHSYEYELRFNDYYDKNVTMDEFVPLTDDSAFYSSFKDTSTYIGTITKTEDVAYKDKILLNGALYIEPKVCTNKSELHIVDIAVKRRHTMSIKQNNFLCDGDNSEYESRSNTNEVGSTGSYKADKLLFNGKYKGKAFKEWTFDKAVAEGAISLSDNKINVNDGCTIDTIVRTSIRVFRVYLLPVTNASTTTIPTMYNDAKMNGTVYNHIGDAIYTANDKEERFSGNDITEANYEALKAYNGVLMFSDDFYNEGKLDEATFDKCSYVYKLAKDTKAKCISDISAQEVTKKLKNKTDWMLKPSTRIDTQDDKGTFSLDFCLLNAGLSLTDTMYYKCNLYLDYDTDGFIDSKDVTTSFEIKDKEDNIVSSTRLKVGAEYELTTDFTEDDLKQLHGVIPYKLEMVTEKNEKLFVSGFVTYPDKGRTIRVLTTENISKLPDTKGYTFKITKLTDLKQKFTNDTVVETKDNNSIKLSDYNVFVTSYPVYDNDLQDLITLFTKTGRTVIYINNKTDKKPLNQTRTALHYNRFGIDDSDAAQSGFDKLLDGDSRTAGLKGFSELYLLGQADKSNAKNKYYIYKNVTKDTFGTQTFKFKSTEEVMPVNDGQILVYPYDITQSYADLSGQNQYHQTFVGTKTSVFLTLGRKYDKKKPSSDIYAIDSGDTYNNAYCFTTSDSIYLGMTDKMNDTEKKLFINALVMAYKNAPTKPVVYLMNEYSDKIDANEATLYVDADVQGTAIEGEVPDLPDSLLTENIDGKKVIKLTYSITNKDNVNDTTATIATDKAYIYDASKNAYVKSVKVSVKKGKTQEYSFLVDSEILNTKDVVTLTTTTGEKKYSYQVKIEKRKLLDLR